MVVDKVGASPTFNPDIKPSHSPLTLGLTPTLKRALPITLTHALAIQLTHSPIRVRVCARVRVCMCVCVCVYWGEVKAELRLGLRLG